WHVPRALLPVAEKRALLLIDPPFEKADELERCVTALNEAIGRMRQTVVAIWYPIKDERQLKRFYQDLEKSSAPKLLRAELFVHAPDDASRLAGSGLAIANAPWGLEEELEQLLPWLAGKLAQSQGDWRLDWLIADRPARARRVRRRPGRSGRCRRHRVDESGGAGHGWGSGPEHCPGRRWGAAGGGPACPGAPPGAAVRGSVPGRCRR